MPCWPMPRHGPTPAALHPGTRQSKRVTFTADKAAGQQAAADKAAELAELREHVEFLEEMHRVCAP